MQKIVKRFCGENNILKKYYRQSFDTFDSIMIIGTLKIIRKVGKMKFLRFIYILIPKIIKDAVKRKIGLY